MKLISHDTIFPAEWYTGGKSTNSAIAFKLNINVSAHNKKRKEIHDVDYNESINGEKSICLLCSDVNLQQRRVLQFLFQPNYFLKSLQMYYGFLHNLMNKNWDILEYFYFAGYEVNVLLFFLLLKILLYFAK